MNRLEIAIAAAREAGAVLRRKLEQTRIVNTKGPRDLVTDADLAAQTAILARLSAADPEAAILSEEGGAAPDLDGPVPTWVIDPLDGTGNYARRLPVFGVCIALLIGGQPELGVVLDPLRQELYYAERGHGAFLQIGRRRPQPLTVSAVAEMGQALLGAGWPREDHLRGQAAALLPRLGYACHSLRLLGSAALTLAYIAAGRVDGCLHLNLQPWDVAAGAALLREAGGQLSDLNGRPWQIHQRALIASNGRLHAELVRCLAAD